MRAPETPGSADAAHAGAPSDASSDAAQAVLPTVRPEQFFGCDLRVGTIVAAEPFPEARVPAIKLVVDFGPLGRRASSAQLTRRYAPTELVGRRVVAVVNFPPRRIAGFKSEVLVLGAVPDAGDVVLLAPDADVPDGTRVA